MSKKWWVIGALVLALLGGCGAVVVGGVTQMAAVIAATSPGGSGGGAALSVGAGGLSSRVPAEVRPWLEKSAKQCSPPLTPGLLAAQLDAESGFNPNVVSHVGATGIAQLMPFNWHLLRDEDGNGVASPTDIGDAVMVQGRMMCSYLPLFSVYSGDELVRYMLASYNAGPGAVLPKGCSKGTVGGACQARIPPYPETQNYVKKIMASVALFSGPSGVKGPNGQLLGPVVDGDASAVAQRAVEIAKAQIGLPYVWGGGGLNGPDGGGFDCSSLVRYAWYQATGGKVEIPRVTWDQVRSLPEVSRDQLAPGDLIFMQTDGYSWSHVVMYTGNNEFVHAPRTGKPIQMASLSDGYYGRIAQTYRRVPVL